jgi:tartrate/fumarate subfamily iron-sulfur-dependent hydro-lyase alpha chain
MVTVGEEVIADTASRLLKRASVELSEDFMNLLRKAYANETNERAKFFLGTMINAAIVAKEESRPLCQDTGIPIFFVTLGELVKLRGDISKALATATERATKETPLRENIVQPLTLDNPGTNVGWGIPYIYYDYKPGADYLEITAIPRGGASSFATSLNRIIHGGELLNSVKRIIIDAVMGAIYACPPWVIGVCVGGTPDIAVCEATKALFRTPTGAPNPDLEVTKLERELFEIVNRLGVGPGGLGGDTTALALHLEIRGTHTAFSSIAVAFNCWPLRRSTARIYSNGTVDYITHPGKGK